MRRWHRWLSLFFGMFVLWIAGTGLLSQFATLYADRVDPPAAAIAAAARAEPGNILIPAARAHDNDVHEAAPAAPSSPAAAAPASAPRRHPAREWVSTLHHLHSGERFGPIGTAISILSGVALLFFAGSGMWMYVQMFRLRSRGGHGDRSWLWR